MFSIFKKPAEDDRTRAVAAYEKVAGITTESHEAHSLRLRMSMLCRAHLDKTFVAGAQQAEAYDMACALAVRDGKTKPEPPAAPLFQKVKSTAGDVMVYLPREFAQEAFQIGMLYQRTELSAEQAIAAAQRLADRISYEALKLTTAFTAVQFLRDELAAEAGEEEGGDGDGAGEGDAPASASS